jgi:spoIIIJ-associated protein
MRSPPRSPREGLRRRTRPRAIKQVAPSPEAADGHPGVRPERERRVGHAEANARTVEAAVEAAAAELGLRPDQVEVEVLEDALPSTFGVIGHPARVRVTSRAGSESTILRGAPLAPDRTVETAPEFSARPTTAGQDVPAVDRSPNGPPPDGLTTTQTSVTRHREVREEPDEVDPGAVESDTELAGDFLEGLLDALDLDGDITTWVDGYGGHVDLEGTDLDAFIGSDGETLQAIQELTRLAVLRQAKHRVRLVVDVNGFRSKRRDELIASVRAVVQRVVETREEHELQPMSASDRKVVHDLVAGIAGARTESTGEEPHRRVLILPA